MRISSDRNATLEKEREREGEEEGEREGERERERERDIDRIALAGGLPFYG